MTSAQDQGFDKWFDLQSIVTLSFVNVTGANEQPLTDTAIDISQARSVYALIDSTDPNNTSTNTDVNIISSPNGTKYEDGVAGIYTSVNIGDGDIKKMLITPGPHFIKVRADENAALRADLQVLVLVRL